MPRSETPYTISGSELFAVADTPTRLTDEHVLVSSITIIAKSGNTDVVRIGGKDVHDAELDGLLANAGLQFSTNIGHIDLYEIYVSVATADEGVDYYASKLAWV